MKKIKLAWKVLFSEYALKTKWLRVKREKVQLASGKVLDDFYTIEGSNLVAILAIDKDGNLILTKQYRHAIKKVTLDLPGGGIGKEELPIEAARRELAEETGFIAGRLEKLLVYYPDSGRTKCVKYIFFASDLKKDTKNIYSQEESEDICLVRMPFKKALEEIKGGKLREATLYMGVFAYLNQLN